MVDFQIPDAKKGEENVRQFQEVWIRSIHKEVCKEGPRLESLRFINEFQPSLLLSLVQKAANTSED